jgi:hypothetical protein
MKAKERKKIAFCVCMCMGAHVILFKKACLKWRNATKMEKRETFIILNQYLMKIMGEGAGGW